MDHEFFTLSCTRKELIELQAALIQRAMVEDEIRREKGLEPVGERALLERIDGLLGLTDDQVETFTQAIDDELWEHAWFSFTDEWAWFRARKDIEKDARFKRTKLDSKQFQELVEERYEKNFEAYLKELEMSDSKTTAKKVSRAGNPRLKS